MRCTFAFDKWPPTCTCCGRRVKTSIQPIVAICRKICAEDGGNRSAGSIAAHARPGTKLKSLLKSWLGVSASPNCSCNARARAMDDNEAREPGWCEKNIDEIVGWLEEEARKRRLPFVRYAAKLLVRRAIRLAYKEAKT